VEECDGKCDKSDEHVLMFLMVEVLGIADSWFS
jgi:hypothetical protein